MVFDSMDETCEYYNHYVYQKGFYVKKEAIKKSQKKRIALLSDAYNTLKRGLILQMVSLSSTCCPLVSLFWYVWIVSLYYLNLAKLVQKLVALDFSSTIADVTFQFKYC